MEKIHALRMDEVKFIARNMYWGAVSIFVLWSSPLFVSMTSFAVYSLVMGKTLSASQVFPAMALFNALRDPLRDLPSVVQTVIQSKVSIDRISSFLNLHEYDPAAVDRNGSAYPKDIAIYVENATFGWTKESPLLKDVNIQVKKGDFVIIHGSVGSGKSSLCAALLGEMEKLSGKVFVRGSVAYYSQQSWIQNMTIRENILFGTAFDEKRYKAVVEACGLIPDFMQLPGGDQTEIGQKGVNLSGGQKARVSLARACYANSDILILDSPLAAVDAVVQSEIFSNCLCKYLEEKTIILVTHSHDIITSDASNYKILMEDGVLKGERVEVTKPRSSYASSPKSKKLNTEDVHAATNKDASKGGLVEEEEREEGRVSADVFSKYFDALGGKFVVVWLFLVQLLWQVFQIASDFWLSHWTGQKNAAYDESRTKYNMRVYSLLGFGSAMMVFIRAMTVAFVGLRASRHLFDSMTHSLLHAPLRFFDANPIGRIVNRYGDDLTSVDLMLPFAYGGFLATFFFTVCQLATAVYTVKILGLLVIPLVYLYVSIGNYYLAPSREISRSWKVSSSPVLSHVTQSEEGVAIIRAFGPDYVDRAISDNHVRIDVSNKVWYSETLTGQWFAVRMQLLGCGIVILVVSALVILKDHMAPGIVGLAFTYAISVDGGLVSLVRVWSWVEICMVSPERILEYAAIPPEGSNNMLVVEPSSQWPQDGSIKFENVVFSYKADAAPVLKGMSFSIGSREKIGIVGRTGAGKSSLTMALFRINELVSGCITIDGVDISSMSLRTLRSRLSIIPQSPVLFKGTLRAYMDPFNEFEDEKIWAAFAKVHLTDMISNLDGKLMHELSENGENFSVGERQMLCMARALLNKSRIVIMDEATASIDHATEKKLQEMINRDFSEATVLTIAHRLATVLDSDRIMVLSDGKVVEFDSPKKLVKKEKGVFYQLAKEGGYLDQIR
jgi:ABC-type multidrug transport system fused ATPase/permease subunit